MYNDFVLVGPKADPAKVKGSTFIAESFNRIAEASAPFVSRGDESGTHVKENEIWKSAGREASGDWYIRAGGGMAQTLRMAKEKDAYTLTDRGTYLALRKELDLEILSEREPVMQNTYSVVIVNPA